MVQNATVGVKGFLTGDLGAGVGGPGLERSARELLELDRSLAMFFDGSFKIFILNNLHEDDRLDAGQNLEPTGLTRKILRNKELATGVWAEIGRSWVDARTIFFLLIAKIFIPNDLLDRDRQIGRQNLEP
jgi:hypothetical protein